MISYFIRLTVATIFTILFVGKPTQAQQDTKLFVFVGEMIGSSALPDGDPVSWDYGAVFKYKVLKKIYGDHPGDTIEFEAYDHQGSPPFSSHKHVLLFVSQHKGRLYHEKYQYFDVYRTRKGGWASPGDPYRFDTQLKAKAVKKVPFLEPVRFDVRNGRLKNIVNITQLSLLLEEPYFEVKDEVATAYFGTDVKDLFLIKKRGILKSRGFF